MMYTRRNRHITSRTPTCDVERTALGQPDEWQQEHGGLYFKLTTPARPHMDLFPGEHASGAMATRPHGNESNEQREIATDLPLHTFLSGEESQHSLPWETIFRDDQGPWGQSHREALCEQNTQHQARQQSAGLASPPSDLIAGKGDKWQDLVSMEDVPEISKGEEPGR